MDPHTETTRASADLVAGLTELLRIAVADQFPETRADVEDMEQLLDALHALRPGMVELRMFSGFVQIVRADWRAALDTFGTLTANAQCMPGSKAMLAYCMDATSDVSWHQLAMELIDDPQAGAQARVLAHALLARNDIEDARLTALRTGTFTEPESLRALRAATDALTAERPEAASASSGAPFAQPMPDTQYLRL
jgi:type III secretion protein HrpB1